VERQRICRAGILAKDLRALISLQQKHKALEDETKTRRSKSEQLNQAGKRLVCEQHPSAPEIENRLESLLEHWRILEELLALRKKQLEEAGEALQVPLLPTSQFSSRMTQTIFFNAPTPLRLYVFTYLRTYGLLVISSPNDIPVVLLASTSNVYFTFLLNYLRKKAVPELNYDDSQYSEQPVNNVKNLIKSFLHSFNLQSYHIYFGFPCRISKKNLNNQFLNYYVRVWRDTKEHTPFILQFLFLIFKLASLWEISYLRFLAPLRPFPPFFFLILGEFWYIFSAYDEYWIT
jgi:hypothetical protein